MFQSVRLWFAGSARWNAGGDIAARCPYLWGSDKCGRAHLSLYCAIRSDEVGHYPMPFRLKAP
jgi:hypothetical protein